MKSYDDFSNKNTSIDKNINAKKENFDAANYNVPNVLIYSQQLFPNFVEDRYGNLSLFTMSYFKPHVLVSDTSKIGCGAAVYLKQKGKYHLIAYYSKKLQEAVGKV